ncbi:MAG: serine hydrolase [Proteobacteria bacterium]|jgi:CubicO group peptidase (beta-lactamase class C family)|nr:serine hydrolase [Pseudomonadota bacterium]
MTAQGRCGRFAIVFFLVACFPLVSSALAGELPTVKPERVGMSSERLKRIDEVMARHIEAGHIQGAVTAVARRGKVVHFKAHGFLDEASQIPMPTDAMFIMMSSTKPVLGVAAMMMIEEGLIRPHDPVSMYIPEFKEMQVAVLKEPADEDISPRRVNRREGVPEHRLVAAEREITIHHLLTHTSGLSCSSGQYRTSARRGPGSARHGPAPPGQYH